MKASNFSDAQKAFIIKQGEDGTPVAEICRKAGISQTARMAPFFQSRTASHGLMTGEFSAGLSSSSAMAYAGVTHPPPKGLTRRFTAVGVGGAFSPG